MSTLAAEKTLNVPNSITVARLFLSFVIFWMIERGGMWTAAAAWFVFAVLTDVLDGWIARRYQIVTTFGRILDPFVDKLITGGVFLFLLPMQERSGVTAWMVVAIIGREMLVTSLRGFLEQKGLDFSANAIGKLKMFLQCAAATVAILLMEPAYRDLGIGSLSMLLLRDVLLWTMTAVTVYSGWIYVQRAIVMLSRTR